MTDVLTAGTPHEDATAAMILIHGRGATAESILTLTPEFAGVDEGIVYLAPQAEGYQWYPQGFMQPIEANEPHLSQALETIKALLERVNEAGIPAERTMLLGFSQGACLATEFGARNARRYGGIVGLSGGLIGPDGTPRDYDGAFDGTPVFLGCSDPDPHIPAARVRHTTEVLSRMGADVTEKLYPNMGHTVNKDEIEHVRRIIQQVTAAVNE
ncbi:MAG: alpha/beta hydrolase [Anaerolineae bacterium]